MMKLRFREMGLGRSAHDPVSGSIPFHSRHRVPGLCDATSTSTGLVLRGPYGDRARTGKGPWVASEVLLPPCHATSTFSMLALAG